MPNLQKRGREMENISAETFKSLDKREDKKKGLSFLKSALLTLDGVFASVK